MCRISIAAVSFDPDLLESLEFVLSCAYDRFNNNGSLFDAFLQVVASQDWPEVTKYAGLVCAQAHRQELIQDLYKSGRILCEGLQLEA